MENKVISKDMNKDRIKKTIYLILIFGGLFLVRNYVPEDLDQVSWGGLLVLIATVLLWLTEAVPMAVTAIFMLFFAGWLGVESQETILEGFSGAGVFFLLGAMIIGQIFSEVGLGRRLSLYTLPLFGSKARNVTLSVMMGTGIISMFLADIPTALIFYGLTKPILDENGCKPGESNFAKAIMIGIPAAAAVGGIGTPAGSGMNAVSMSLLKNITGLEVTFGQWSIVGVPIALASTFLAWLILTTIWPPEIDEVKGLDKLKEDRKHIGSIRGDELKFTIVFAFMVFSWFFPQVTGLSMYMTTWLGILILSLPGMEMVHWKKINGNIDWSTVLICGSATALATVVANLGTGAWLSKILYDLFLGRVADQGLFILILVIGIMMAVGHYLMPQGVSLVGLMLPVVAALAEQLGINPIVICMPVMFSTSMLLLVPIDPTVYTTYSGGYWKLKEMMVSGVFITLAYIIVSSILFTFTANIGILS